MGREQSIHGMLRGSRPFPLDKERKTRCMAALDNIGITLTELASYLGVDKSFVSSVISGRQPSPAMESKIAAFLGMDEADLFPPRTPVEIQAMRRAEAREKAESERKKREWLAAKRETLRGVA